jgi:hypothetical protein
MHHLRLRSIAQDVTAFFVSGAREGFHSYVVCTMKEDTVTGGRVASDSFIGFVVLKTQ